MTLSPSSFVAEATLSLSGKNSSTSEAALLFGGTVNIRRQDDGGYTISDSSDAPFSCPLIERLQQFLWKSILQIRNNG